MRFQKRIISTLWIQEEASKRNGRKQHNEELCVLKCGQILLSWRMRWAGHVILMGELKSACGIVCGNPQGRRPL